jgi:cytochrome b561
VDFFSSAKKLKIDVMNQHHVHPSFGVFATLAGMRRCGNTARHRTPARIKNSVKRLPAVLCHLLLLRMFLLENGRSL